MGVFFDFTDSVFTDIIIPNFVSEQYIEECKDNDDLRRKVVKFITTIADIYNVGLESLTKLRDQKVEYFIQNQQSYKDTESHYRIITELAESYYSDHARFHGESYQAPHPSTRNTVCGSFLPCKAAAEPDIHDPA